MVLRSFFFEEKAFNDDQELRQDKMLSINKVGHGKRLLYLRCSPICSLSALPVAACAHTMTCDANKFMLFHETLTPHEGQIDRTEVMPGLAPPPLTCTHFFSFHSCFDQAVGGRSHARPGPCVPGVVKVSQDRTPSAGPGLPAAPACAVHAHPEGTMPYASQLQVLRRCDSNG